MKENIVIFGDSITAGYKMGWTSDILKRMLEEKLGTAPCTTSPSAPETSGVAKPSAPGTPGTPGIPGEANPSAHDNAKPDTNKTAPHTDNIFLEGECGDDTDGGVRRLRLVTRHNPDKVFVFFGANDAAEYCPVTPRKFAVNLSKIISTLGTEKTVIITPPYCNEEVLDFRTNEQVEAYRDIAIEAAKSNSTQLIDLYEKMTSSVNPNSLLQADGLHFSVKGYDLLTGLIADNIAQ
jgi:lysophospholipase L1-like esterase